MNNELHKITRKAIPVAYRTLYFICSISFMKLAIMSIVSIIYFISQNKIFLQIKYIRNFHTIIEFIVLIPAITYSILILICGKRFVENINNFLKEGKKNEMVRPSTAFYWC